MKTTTIIIAAFFALQVNVLFAGDEKSSPVINEKPAVTVISLLPVTPAEATFEDAAEFNMSRLAPVTPNEATFEEENSETNLIKALAPVTPAAADFDDSKEMISPEPGTLAPVTPAEADFE